MHAIKTGSHSHILIHSQVQILLIHVSWGATPLDFLSLVKVKLSLSYTQPTPENQRSQPLKDPTQHQYVQKVLGFGFSADHFLLTQGASLPSIPSHMTLSTARRIKILYKATRCTHLLIVRAFKFQNLCPVFKHATSMLLTGSRRADPWLGQEGERLYKSLEFELQQSSPRTAGTLGLGTWGFLCSPPLNHLDNSTYITYSLSVEGLLSPGNYINIYIFCACDVLGSLH